MSILALDSHATYRAILTCLHSKNILQSHTYSDEYEENNFVSGKVSTECLVECNLDDYFSVVAALCKHREENVI